MKLTIDMSGIGKLIGIINEDAGKNARFASSLALNKTALIVKDVLTKSISTTFSEPSAYTQNALMMQPSTKTNLVAQVRFKDGVTAKHYLEPQVYGGPRAQKRSETQLIAHGQMGAGMAWVPGKDARLVGGGMSKGQIIQILSGLNASMDAYANSTARSRKRGKRRNDYYFAIPINSTTLTPGIYHSQQGKITQRLLRFVKTPSYKKIWDYWGIAQKTTAENFDEQMRLALAFELATRRRQ